MATRDLVSLVFTADDRQVQQALTRTDKGLDGLGGQAEKSGGRVQKSFSGAGDSVKGLAGRIPGVGGALSGLGVTPAGASDRGYRVGSRRHRLRRSARYRRWRKNCGP